MKILIFLAFATSIIFFPGCAQISHLTPEQIHQKYLAQNPGEDDYAKNPLIEDNYAKLQRRLDEQHQYAQEQAAKGQTSKDVKQSTLLKNILPSGDADIFYVPYQKFSDGTPATIFLTNKRNT